MLEFIKKHYMSEKRLWINILDFIYPIVLSYVIYDRGIYSKSMPLWSIIILCFLFCCRAFLALLNIVKNRKTKYTQR